MKETIDFYNNHAEKYFDRTSQVDLETLYKEFLNYVPSGGRIMDVGCGSGRDVKWFRDHGYEAYGMDASEELVKLARERLEIQAFTADMSSWITGEPYDGIWCCASIMHLGDDECRHFFINLNHNLKPRGAFYMSVKSGIKTGKDEEGRYLKDFMEEEVRGLVSMVSGLQIRELWYTEDKLLRNNFKWLNVIAVRK